MGQNVVHLEKCSVCLEEQIPLLLVWLSGLSASLRNEGWLVDSQSGHVPGFRATSPVGGV